MNSAQMTGLVSLHEILAAIRTTTSETVGLVGSSAATTSCNLVNNNSIESGMNKINASGVDGNENEGSKDSDADVDSEKKEPEIYHVEPTSDLIRELINVDKHSGLDIIGHSLCNKLTTSCSSSKSLPAIVVEKMLKDIQNVDQETMMSCRLVCVQWNSIIENTSELIKNITFPIWHSKPFLDLDIVKKGKVKSVKFTNPLQLKSIYTKTLLENLSKMVEKIEIAFEDPDLSQQNELFKLILENFSNLQELVISPSIIKDPVLAKKPQKIFRGITISTNIAAAIGITNLCINVNGFVLEDANGLTEFILKLPHLKNIELISYCVSYFTIITGICSYIKKYDSRLQLKKLSLSMGQIVEKAILETYIVLLILYEKHSIELDGQANIDLDFNSFLRLTTTPNLALDSRRPLFSTSISGQLTFKGPKLTNLDRLDNLNIDSLTLYFKRDLHNGELDWIKKLNSLECIIFHKGSIGVYGDGRLGLPTITEFDDAFSNGLTTVKDLCILYDIFDTIRVFRWNIYFPNLVDIYFSNCKLTPNFLISELTELKCLSRIKLDNLPNLTDTVFTIDCVNKFATIGSSNIAPAICCFKALKIIQIVDCPLLTNECIINGISKCITLEQLEIQRCINISEVCCELIVEWVEVEFKKE